MNISREAGLSRTGKRALNQSETRYWLRRRPIAGQQRGQRRLDLSKNLSSAEAPRCAVSARTASTLGSAPRKHKVGMTMAASSSLMSREADVLEMSPLRHRNWRKTSVRAFSTAASLVAFTLCWSSPSGAQDFQCPSPAQQTDSNLRVEVDGKAQTILRLGAAELKGSVERTVQDLYSKYPNADRVAIASMVLSTTCQMIRNSPQLSDSEKFEKWMAVLQIIRTLLPDDKKSERRDDAPGTTDKPKGSQEFRDLPRLGLQHGPATSPPYAADTAPPTPPTGQRRSLPSQVRPPMRQASVCITACLTPAQWAACPTKSWWADSKDHRFRTPRFFQQCGTVCKPPGSPNLAYKAADGGWVVFRFPQS
ncbi:MAG: hypothetical protein QOI10_4118 [Solirubrobacterales bacterium]|nr:hypothetical protein [Solirubrobacterales bacterium]